MHLCNLGSLESIKVREKGYIYSVWWFINWCLGCSLQLVYLVFCFTFVGSILPYPIYLRMVLWKLKLRFGDRMIWVHPLLFISWEYDGWFLGSVFWRWSLQSVAPSRQPGVIGSWFLWRFRLGFPNPGGLWLYFGRGLYNQRLYYSYNNPYQFGGLYLDLLYHSYLHQTSSSPGNPNYICPREIPKLAGGLSSDLYFKSRIHPAPFTKAPRSPGQAATLAGSEGISVLTWRCWR